MTEPDRRHLGGEVRNEIAVGGDAAQRVEQGDCNVISGIDAWHPAG
ncbi:hypothetical protein [Sagittula marina]